MKRCPWPISCRRLLSHLLAMLVVAATGSAPAPSWAGDDDVARAVRYMSLGADQVNVRSGPGVRYPIQWVFQRLRVPVEVTEEWENWRKIRDWEGAEGWVHRSLLSARRTAIVVGEIADIRTEPGTAAKVVARAEPGVIVGLKQCREAWCEVEAQRYDGWVPRGAIWGVGPRETLK